MAEDSGEIVEIEGNTWYEDVRRCVDRLLSGEHTIRSKDGIEKLVPNLEQRQVLKYVLDCAKHRVPCRFYVLKARQVGMSTIIAALIYELCCTIQGMQGLVAAHNQKGCNALWKMYLRYKDYDEREPNTTRFSQKEMVFKGLDSGIAVTVANEDMGRGDTINFLHASEYAFWEDDEEALEAVMAAVPKGGNYRTIVAIESTGQPGTDFEDQYRRYYDMQEKYLKEEDGKKPLWLPFFFPWYAHEEYSIECYGAEQREILSTTDPDERELLAAGVKPNQIKWRRWCIENDFNGKVHKFKSQNPAFVDEAFSIVTETWFDKEALMSLKRRVVTAENAKDHPDFARYNVELTADHKDSVCEMEDDGELRIYTPPIIGHKYTIGGDAAAESKQGPFKYDKSESALVVVDNEVGDIVACWNGSMNAHAFGDFMAAVGYLYNAATLAPEVNNHGHSTVQRLAHGLGYPSIYKQERRGRTDIAETDLLGWKQNKDNRTYMLDTFQRLVKEFKINIPDATLVEQMSYFVKDVKSGHKGAGKDDLVISAGIALTVASEGKQWGVKDRKALRRAKTVEPRYGRRSPRASVPHPDDFGGLFGNPGRNIA